MSIFKIDQEKIVEKREAEVKARRRSAYQDEADSLFFKAQRGEIPLQVWLDKVDEIKKRYPAPL